MAEAIASARRLAAQHTYESFALDEIAVAAVERFIGRISEASRRIEPSLKDRHPTIAWSDVAGIGNVLRHDYDDVDLVILWRIVTSDLAELERVVAALLRDLGEDPREG